MDQVKQWVMTIGIVVWETLCTFTPVHAGEQPTSSDALEIEVTKKGLGKQVIISQGAKEWFMLIDVTPENSVVVRQEKNRDQYVIDESETHDRPMTQGEVDAAIADYINSVKTRVQRQ